MTALALRNWDIWTSAASTACSEFWARDQANRVLSLCPAAGLRGGDANEPAPSQRKIEFHAMAAGDDGALQMRQTRELDHGIDDLIAV
jgi:hypothetical protein